MLNDKTWWNLFNMVVGIFILMLFLCVVVSFGIGLRKSGFGCNYAICQLLQCEGNVDFDPILPILIHWILNLRWVWTKFKWASISANSDFQLRLMFFMVITICIFHLVSSCIFLCLCVVVKFTMQDRCTSTSLHYIIW